MFDVLRNARLLVAPRRACHKTTDSHHRFRRHPNLLKAGPQQVSASASEQVTTTLDAELVPGAGEVARLSAEVSATLRQCQQSGQTVLRQVEAIGASEAQLVR